MTAVLRPQLRSHRAVEPAEPGGGYVIWDRLRLTDQALRLTPLQWGWLRLFDGRRSLREVRDEASRRLGVPLIPLDVFERLVKQLDEALFLDSPHFRSRFEELTSRPVRPPVCVGSYEADPAALRRQVEHCFTAPGGPGLPGPRRPDPAFRAALVPHIDYRRGGVSYGWAYKEVFERSDAMLFVIVGTSHYSQHRFTLTRKHFHTPLGTVQTDQAFVDRLVAHYGAGLFEDEIGAHLPEHSIELEVVFLQYLYPDRPIRIVPLVVGRLHDGVISAQSPGERSDVARMIAALRAAEEETGEPICYLISGDLAHIGPKFGDARPLQPAQLAHSRHQDQAIVSHAIRADAAAYHRLVADEGDARRICGLPPTYVVLQAAKPSSGRLLHYGQWTDPLGHESVSFASMALFR